MSGSTSAQTTRAIQARRQHTEKLLARFRTPFRRCARNEPW